METDCTSSNRSPELWFEGDDEGLPDEQEETSDSEKGDDEE